MPCSGQQYAGGLAAFPLPCRDSAVWPDADHFSVHKELAMFFDTLESRQMFSATVPHALHIPTKREAAIAMSRHSKAIQPAANAPKVSAAAARVAAQNRALVTA